MTEIKWEPVAEGEIRAEVEAVLDNTGESKQIRHFLNTNEDVDDWKEKIRSLCRQVVAEKGPENLTADAIFEHIHQKAHDIFPKEVYQQITEKLTSYLSAQYEDHI